MLHVSNSEMRIFRQGQGHQETTRFRGDVACHVAQGTTQIDADIGEIDHFWMENAIDHGDSALLVQDALLFSVKLRENPW